MFSGLSSTLAFPLRVVLELRVLDLPLLRFLIILGLVVLSLRTFDLLLLGRLVLRFILVSAGFGHRLRLDSTEGARRLRFLTRSSWALAEDLSPSAFSYALPAGKLCARELIVSSVRGQRSHKSGILCISRRMGRCSGKKE